MPILNHDIKFLPGVGDRRGEILRAELGIATFGDLLLHAPFRYLDRTKFVSIAEIQRAGGTTAAVQVRARVEHVQLVGEGHKGRLVVTVSDGTAIAEMVWFQRTSWALKSIDREREYIWFGSADLYNGHVSMVHPEFEPVGLSNGAVASGITGVYSVTEKMRTSGLGTRAIAGLVRTLWERIDRIEESLPSDILLTEGLLPRIEALRQVHFPQSEELLGRALYRLKFEELFLLQLDLLHQKQVRTERSTGFVFETVGELFNKFYKEVLPFPLTQAQKRVVRELRIDMHTGHQMNRLLQGDVGSGKTIVALLGALIALDNGYQAAIMAPTEILANQHYVSLSELCEPLGVKVALLTGSTKKRERTKLLEALGQGEIHILVGTHAIIEDPVAFHKLGFVVIDEQHRFGVLQRARIRAKGFGATEPHILVMSATPIPRTLAMTLYGDLDVSIIDELPPGRVPIRTIHATEGRRLRAYGFIAEQIALGRQVYIVYPLIEESEKLDLLSLEEGASAIMAAFPPEKGYVTVVVHGKMTTQMKDFGMNLFKEGKAHILIATTVIEVGVNVPNATVMLIENAERFGLSQLHQLRGRVGRGADQAYCILMSKDKLSADAKKRLATMVATTDGFEIAQVDLELRGAGDQQGVRQSGQAIEIRFADLARDGAILASARGAAEKLLLADPDLGWPQHFPLRVLLNRLRTRSGVVQFDLSAIS